MIGLWLLMTASADAPAPPKVEPRFLPAPPTLLSQVTPVDEPQPLAHPL
jgi:hypothetical protein